MTHSGAPSKAELRARLTSARKLLAQNPANRTALAQQLAQLVQAYQPTRVAAYLPYGDEPDIGGFLDSARESDLELVMPKSRPDGELDWVIWNGQSEPGIFRFDEPLGETTDLASVQVVLLPALAVDLTGHRLGKGKGYYDRALANLNAADTLLVAVVYDDEVLDSLPAETHDHPVHAVVTPTRTIALGTLK